MSLQNKNNRSFWIQTNKLVKPSISQNIIARERLFKSLEPSENSAVTCVHAPAGFGKTTLVASWLEARQRPHYWYSFDTNDNDVDFFLRHLVQMVNQGPSAICDGALSILEQSDAAQLPAILSAVLAALAQNNAPQVVVFDHLDCLTNRPLIVAISQWLKLFPAHIHLVLCWQHNAPMSMASLKVTRPVVSINRRQLQFTEAETLQYVNSLAASSSAEINRAGLCDAMAGWPAALTLAAQHELINSENTPAFVPVKQEILSALSIREIQDYLLQEVFFIQPAPLQKALLVLSLFEQFNLPLCQAMLTEADASTVITELLHRQLFIVEVAEKPAWFCLEPLVRRCLKQHFKSVDYPGFLRLKQQLVQVFLAQGFHDQAVTLAIKLQASAVVFNVLEQVGMQLYQQGQFKQLSQLFDCANIDAVKRHPNLSVLYAWLLLATYQEGSVPALLADHFEGANDGDAHAEHCVAQAQAAINAENFQLANELAEQAMNQLAPESFVSRTVCYSIMGQSALCSGQLNNAIELLKEAEKNAYQHRLMPQRLWSMCLISDAYTALGKIETALDIQQNAIDMAHEHRIDDVLHMEFLYRNRIHLRIEQGDLAAADKLLMKSEKVIAPLGRYGQLNNFVHRGLLALWRNQTSTAQRYAEQVNQLLQQHQYHTDWLAHAHDFLLLSKQMGCGVNAPHFVWREQHLNCTANNHFYQHYQRSYAVYLYLEGKQEDAIERLKALVPLAQTHHLVVQALKNKIQLAVWLNNETGEAYWRSVLPALAILKPLSSLWLAAHFTANSTDRHWPDWHIWFHPEGREAEPVNEQPVALLAALNQRYASPEDQVTPKELQVLLLIGTGLNNDEIAANMHIAVSTVKSHIRRLYRKLRISKRSQAVQVFRHL